MVHPVGLSCRYITLCAALPTGALAQRILLAEVVQSIPENREQRNRGQSRLGYWFVLCSLFVCYRSTYSVLPRVTRSLTRKDISPPAGRKILIVFHETQCTRCAYRWLACAETWCMQCKMFLHTHGIFRPAGGASGRLSRHMPGLEPTAYLLS
jgi:hypothetical protein